MTITTQSESINNQEQAVTLYVINIACPDDQFRGTENVGTAAELAKYNRDPDGYAAALLGLSRDEYREWVALDGEPQCGCQISTGRPCGRRPKSTRPHSKDFDIWKRFHRRCVCGLHKGQQPILDAAPSEAWLLALAHEREITIRNFIKRNQSSLAGTSMKTADWLLRCLM